METIQLQELKAVLIHENILENPLNILKENCLTIQRLVYDCVHNRNHVGEVNGTTEPVILTESEFPEGPGICLPAGAEIQTEAFAGDESIFPLIILMSEFFPSCEAILSRVHPKPFFQLLRAL